jgi:hypothetical protein
MQIVVLLPLLIFSSLPMQQKFNPFEKLKGSWTGKVQGADYLETWQSSGDNYSGFSETRSQGKLVSGEKMTIITDKGKIIYRAIPDGQNPVEFSLEKMKPDTLWFSNPGHDYPKHIVYTFKQDSLIATISGEPFGAKSLTFRLKKK